ncbi:hypothetical protein C2845_PM06G25130 [Panicum miliaceum]|uniref:Uncharacterized protein n=1 Tax=Panicum miliaceum TaxID=4540 RepID=A0A3L6R8K1_PANMI|nr:hypothetical protein C2845_PM06G25130 [Panicum miliaceum]
MPCRYVRCPGPAPFLKPAVSSSAPLAGGHTPVTARGAAQDPACGSIVSSSRRSAPVGGCPHPVRRNASMREQGRGATGGEGIVDARILCDGIRADESMGGVTQAAGSGGVDVLPDKVLQHTLCFLEAQDLR